MAHLCLSAADDCRLHSLSTTAMVVVVIYNLLNQSCSPIATVTPIAAVGAAAALGGDPLGVGQQRHLAGVLDRRGDVPLLLGVVPAHPAGADLGAVRHEALQQVDVLVVDVVDPLLDEDAGLLLDLLGRCPCPCRALAVAVSCIRTVPRLRYGGRGGCRRPAPSCVAAAAAAALGAAAVVALDLGGGPAQAGADLVGDDLDHVALVAFVRLVRALLEAAVDDDPGALGERRAAFSPSWPQAAMLKNEICSCHSFVALVAPVDGDAEGGDGLAAGVKRSSGSRVMLPTRVTVVAMVAPSVRRPVSRRAGLGHATTSGLVRRAGG